MSEDEARAVSNEIVAETSAIEMQRELEGSQDFDRIGQEALSGMDTSGLDALGN